MNDKEPAQVEVAYSTLHSMIVDGTLAQGQDLNERALADAVGTSRTPVREAVAQLVRDGLAERHNRRVRVTEWNDEKVGQLYEMRGLLESEAARLAAMRRSPNAVLRMERSLEEQKALTDPSPTERRRLNYEFHHEIWAASGNPLLVEANQKYGIQSYSLTPTSLRSDERWNESLEDHALILEHISAQQPHEAAEAMAAHLRGAFRHR